MSKENSEQEFLTILHRLEPASVQDLCDATSVTATAIRQRLLRLQMEGFVSRETVRQERGRPHHVYTVTHEGLKTLGDDQGEMAALLWREISRIPQEEVRNHVLAGVKSALVERFGNQETSGTIENRLRRLCETLSGFGFDVDFVSPEPTADAGKQLPILREHNCPYHELAAEDPTFCELEQSVFSEILGTPVELSACRFEGHRHCEFQVGVAGPV